MLPTATNLHQFTVKETGYVEITLLGVVPQLVAGPSAPITVGLGIFPQPLLDLVRQAAQFLT